jgi:archaetidylinositol phosphate synthase
MLDSKYSEGKISKLIKKITEKYLLNKISANQMTCIGLILGILSALCIFIYSFVPLSSGFQTYLLEVWQNLRVGKFNLFIDFFQERGGIISWEWQFGDTILFLSGIFMLLSFLSDVFDGTIARLTSPTIFGGIFDIFSDRFVELILIIALVTTDPSSLLWPGIISFAAIVECITIFLLMGSSISKSDIKKMEEKNKVIYYSSGIMERTETFIFIFLMLCFAPFRIFLLWLFGLLVWFTAFQRFYHTYQIFYSNDEKF